MSAPLTVQDAAKAVVTDIYRTWHACGLKKAERGIPAGTLCDACNEEIKWRVEQMLGLIVNGRSSGDSELPK